MSIDAEAQVAIILLACGPCVAILNCLGQVLYLGRAPRTKETLPDFHEWCRVTQHPRVFRGLTGCQRTPRFWGVTHLPQTSHTTSTSTPEGIPLNPSSNSSSLPEHLASAAHSGNCLFSSHSHFV